jgi:hypothetical protein
MAAESRRNCARRARAPRVAVGEFPRPSPAGPWRGVGSTQEFPTFDGTYTALESITKTIGGDGLPKIN